MDLARSNEDGYLEGCHSRMQYMTKGILSSEDKECADT